MTLQTLCLRAATLFTLLVTAGCALQPGAPDQPQTVERTRATAFDFEGRLAASDGKQAASGVLLWSHRMARDEWTVLSPLGQIVARVVATPDGATLQTADGQHIKAPDVSSLLPQLLGVNAPADHLKYWVQGVAAPGARVLQLDAAGRPQRIADSGWIIDYPAYADDSPEAAPRRIDAHWDETRLKIVVDVWTPLP